MMISFQYDFIQCTSYFPRFGFCFPASIFNAVDFPIPFVPTNPKTSPGLGVGSLYSNDHHLTIKKFLEIENTIRVQNSIFYLLC